MNIYGCPNCARILATPARDLVLFEWSQMDRCRTNLYYEQEGQRIRTLAVIECAKAGHQQ